MMAEPNKTEDQLTAEDFPRKGTNLQDRAIADDSITRADSATAGLERRRLLRNEASRNEIQDAENPRPSGIDPSTTTGNRAQDAGGSVSPLFSDSEIGDLRSRWSNIQAEFVDEPRHAVEQADQLVARAMQRLQEGFSNERASLEKQWESGKDASTEDLRLALQRYRTFFGRLLNAA